MAEDANTSHIRFSTLDEYREYGKQNLLTRNHSDEQKRAIGWYTRHGFKAANPYLRSGRDPDSVPWADELPDIDRNITLIDESMRPLPHSIVVTREVDKDAFRKKIRRLKRLGKLKGRTEGDDAYMSTSLAPKPLRYSTPKPIVLRLHVPQGTPAIYTGPYSQFGDEEAELLLARGLRYRIDKVEFDESDGRGRWWIDAHVLLPGSAR
ncbi:hypothetical protein B0T44_16365 [Nocardia donostiensis]|uniref:ADP ribosyltransferase domain-containing protein n=1 Tax=Nocardia donostiensis TaxID=1538463 RepID=A0A1W0AQI5_9NOCA|nr:hypothetical protein B0T46_22080 [Nocardia donostiensis]OQS12502.1 hypothetical protein B0T36_24465 [Nocardia donostiensis]OQS19048.1 hypothetical protein B0T44_16365 [Nocardia donostiensis]